MVIYTIIGIVCGIILCYLCLKKKLKTTQYLDEQTIQKNKILNDQSIELQNQLNDLKSKYSDASLEMTTLEIRKNGIINSIKDLDAQAQQAGEVLYNQAIEQAQLNIEAAMEKMSQEYFNAEQACKNQYNNVAQECAAELSTMMALKNQEISELSHTLDEMRSKTNSAVAANKRAEEMRQSTEFYKLHLSEVDVQEIEMLRNVVPYLRDKEPLNKVIWKCYYEKPTTDLIGRVVGSGVHCGIYKITNLENGMCYIGQAVSIADRWKQHIKRGVGAEAPTRNKLYPAMIALGPESFSFEIVEECPRESLDEREDYWQDYFKAKEFGYSIK